MSAATNRNTQSNACAETGVRDERNSLVGLLRIDRGPEPSLSPPPRRATRPRRLAIVVAVVTIAVAAAAYWYRQAVVPAVRVGVALPTDALTTPGASSVLDASGYIVARRQATVSARIIGRVSQMLIEEGQQVEEGQVIARLDDASAAAALAQSQAQLAQAEANVRSARSSFHVQNSLFERQRKQFEARLISAQDFDNSRASHSAAESALDVAEQAAKVAAAALEVARQNLAETVIRAPFAGVVTVKAAQPGEIVSPSSVGGFTRTGIGTIVDMSSLELEVDISESFIHRVQAGQPAVVTLNAYPAWQIPATVVAVVPTADRAKATVKVRIALRVEDARVVPEMGAKVTFLNNSKDPRLPAETSTVAVVVPAESVRTSSQDRKRGDVFVVVDGRLHLRTVQLGQRVRGGQVVLGGLQPSEQVVLAPDPSLRAGSRVRMVD